MESDEIFYTDGESILITSSTLQVGDRSYSLKNIKGRSLAILQPVRLPGLIVFLTGVGLALFGMGEGFPLEAVRRFETSQGIDLNSVAQWTGLGFVILGLVFTVLTREKYAVRIATDEGEQDAVVSTQKEYIREILDGLNRAYIDADMNAQRRLRRVRTGV